MTNTQDNSIMLNGTEHINTFGGEAWVDDFRLAEYGVQLGDNSIHGLTPEQAVQLATVLVDHLILCGHRFEIKGTNNEYQRERLVHVESAP